MNKLKKIVEQHFDGQQQQAKHNATEPFQSRDITPISAGRKFQVSWFDDYKWFEWGFVVNAAFCHHAGK